VATETRKVGVVGDGQGSDMHIGNNEWELRAWKEGDDKIRASRYSTKLGKPCGIYVYNMCGSNLSRKPYHWLRYVPIVLPTYKILMYTQILSSAIQWGMME
jgi:hypothetical protein